MNREDISQAAREHILGKWNRLGSAADNMAEFAVQQVNKALEEAATRMEQVILRDHKVFAPEDIRALKVK